MKLTYLNFRSLLLATTVLLVAGAVLVGGVVHAASGDLDRAFGLSGLARASVGPGRDLVTDMARQSDGRLIVVGSTSINSRENIFLVRFNANGGLDNTFDGDGRVTTHISAADDDASAVALQPDGKILVAATTSIGTNNTNRELMVLRYNNDGSLDGSFDGDGYVISAISNQVERAVSLHLQSDGKIIVFGITPMVTLGVVAIRYNSDGSLDPTFGTGGRFVTSMNSPRFSPNAFAVQGDGKIVMAGVHLLGATFSETNFGFARLNADGSPDTTFDGDGVAIVKLNPDPARNMDSAAGLAIQPDGKLVAAGYSLSGPSTDFDSALVRVNSDGSLDTGFDNDGKLVLPVSTRGEGLNSVALRGDGRIVSGGTARLDGNDFFTLVQLNSNGSLDEAFGAHGKVLTSFPSDGGMVFRLLIAPDQKLLAVGLAGAGNSDVGIAQYRSNGFREADFDGDKLSDVSLFRPAGGGWYILGSESGFYGLQFGIGSDLLGPADFDGDGQTDICVFRDGAWYWLNSSDGSFQAVQFGLAGDIPRPADFDGDGKADPAVFRAGSWYVLQSQLGFTGFPFGAVGDRPITADFDGDGKADPAVFRDGAWYVLRSQLGFTAVSFGIATDKPVVGDYDGDGLADQAVYRDGAWYILGSHVGFYGVSFGIATDIPSPADYDGDGKTDPAVFRAGAWYMLRSQQGYSAVQFGITGDQPVPAAFLP